MVEQILQTGPADSFQNGGREMVGRPDPCMSPRCRFYDSCPLRPVTSNNFEAIDRLSPGRKADISFELDNDFSGRVASLYINGSINKSALPVLGQFERLLPILDGVFIVFDSTGGHPAYEERLTEIISSAAAIMPVVSFAKMALSAAFTAALSARKVFSLNHAQLGAVGALLPVCNGIKPQTMLSRGSPKKPTGDPVRPKMFVTMADKKRIQDSLDRSFDETVDHICLYRQRTVKSVIKLLDGRFINAKEAVQVGLIDGLTDFELDAYSQLLEMVEKHKPTKEKKSGS